MRETDIKFLLEIGLNEEKARQTIKNTTLTNLLRSSVEKAQTISNCTIDKSIGILIYNLVTKLKPQIKDHLPIILQYIACQQIVNDVQLNAALEYLLTNPTHPIDNDKFIEACGIGIVVTPEEIEKKVSHVIQKYKDEIKVKRYKFNIGTLVGEVRKTLKWADGKNVKSEIDVQILDLIGPKGIYEIKETMKSTETNVKTKPIAQSMSALNGHKDLAEPVSSKAPKTVIPSILEYYKTLNFHKPGENYKTDGYVITPNTMDLLQKHLSATGGKVVTRFPPEPNGILHLGHAKAINIDFGYAKAHDGICYLRYDDTNPEKEEEKFFLGIEEMVRWLGYTPYKITHSSDYFQKLYEMAVLLIERGHAYVCHQSAVEMKGFNPTPSPWRERPISESLALFEDMRKGKIDEGKATLRMKITLEEGKMDPVAYRIKFVPHHRTGVQWCIYPTYDFTHCLCDSFENITHSLCTKEFQSRRSSYYWLCNVLDLYCPVQWEYGRLNVNNTVVSKRKIAKLIEKGIVKDWDDPRLFTLTALKRRGFPASAINNFCTLLGVTTAQVTVDAEMLESVVRDELNLTAKRAMAVLEPLKITILNWSELFGDDKVKTLEVPDYPADPAKGIHKISFGSNIYIDRTDFKEGADKSYRRLTESQSVGLRYANVILKVEEILRFPNRDIVSHIKVKAEIPDEGNKPKAFIHWVHDPLICEVRLYEKLFLHKNPENVTQVPNGFLDDINPDSAKIIPHALVDRSILGAPTYEKFQFERLGFFSVDPDSKPEKMVFNRCVSLREDAKK